MSALPQPTTDRARAKSDLNRHGYCIAADDVAAGASPELLALLGFRVWGGYGKLDDPGVECIARPGAKKK